ncbi:hypothetical protein FDP41_006664 [Naegleria fowleri]|uniref:F-box domain-containing protein n=1 Tax=Naegleria fowleri TaxID=5763 RepID=A0A6A5BJ38_NAEFO|nr:uncharacterized protein FDP41_006664 [Naegleria fowleri]KAF0974054.1 hypothetical protein FDP41_006664 [Naegleria fowleri]CAG4712778.1 unnamed protein product [Naegleria fowleri]
MQSRIRSWNRSCSPSQHSHLPFEQFVPPEVIFLIFSYLDFRYLFKTIPFVCSEWRRLIIERVDTLHIYPNVENYLEESESCTNVVDKKRIQYNEMMVEKDIIPFIKYITKFVKSNHMKISHLFLNGGISNTFRKRQYAELITFYKLCNASNSKFSTYVFKSPKESNRDELLNAMKKEAGQECCFTNTYTMPYSDTVNVSEYCVGGLSENMILFSDSDTPSLSELIRVVSPHLKTLVLSHCILKQRFLNSIFVNLCNGLKNLVLEHVATFGDVDLSKLPVEYLDSTETISEKLEKNCEVMKGNSVIDGEILGNLRKASMERTSSSILSLLESLKNYHGEKKTECLELRIRLDEYSYFDSNWLDTSIGMTGDHLYSLIDSFKKLKSFTIEFETTLDELIFQKRDSRFFPTTKLDLPLLEELRLKGRSFLSNHFDELISIPSLKLLSCQVTSGEDVEQLKKLLKNSENLEQLEIQLVAVKSKDFEISLIEMVTSLVVNKDQLKHLIFRNISFEHVEYLVQMMKTISNTEKLINLGVQFKGPYELPTQMLVEHLRQQAPQNIRLCSKLHATINYKIFKES